MGADYKTAVFSYYRYYPSLGAAVVYASLFSLSLAVHIIQMVRRKTWFFIPFAIGAVLEIIGYIFRAISSTQSPNWTMVPFLIQTLTLLVAPAFYAASIYMELGRIILVTDGESLSIIKKRVLTKLFVSGDILSFIMQGAGGGLMASHNESTINTGSHIIVGGLFVQVCFFGFFVLTALVFHRRMLLKPTTRSQSITIAWQKHLFALYGTSIAIFIRSTYRVVEYLEGWKGYIMYHELFVYIFDAALMISVQVIMNVIHPGEINRDLNDAKGNSNSESVSGAIELT